MESPEELIKALSNGAIPDPVRPPFSQDCRFATPTQNSNIISGTGCYGLQIWPVHSQGLSEQKPIKTFEEKGARACRVTVQIFLGYRNYLRNG